MSFWALIQGVIATLEVATTALLRGQHQVDWRGISIIIVPADSPHRMNPLTLLRLYSHAAKLSHVSSLPLDSVPQPGKGIGMTFPPAKR